MNLKNGKWTIADQVEERRRQQAWIRLECEMKEESRVDRTPGKNPFRRETWNLTEQMRLERENPELAERWKEEAGV